LEVGGGIPVVLILGSLDIGFRPSDINGMKKEERKKKSVINKKFEKRAQFPLTKKKKKIELC
jgi:hypothetical protein